MSINSPIFPSLHTNLATTQIIGLSISRFASYKDIEKANAVAYSAAFVEEHLEVGF